MRLAARTHFWIWLGYWAFLFAVTHAPLRGVGPAPIPHVDKVAHVGLYFILAWLGGTLRAKATGADRLRRVAAWTVIYAIYGAVDEWSQPLVGRSMELGDWIADVGGVLLGGAVVVWRGASEKTHSSSSPDGGPL